MIKRLVVPILSCLTVIAVQAQPVVDVHQLMTDVTTLAADSMEGRVLGSAGGQKARLYIEHAFARMHLEKLGDDYVQSFPARGRSGNVQGTNVFAYIPGTVYPDTFIVLTAHYDHLGIRRGVIFNGADDNASGVAGLLAIADYFRRHPPAHSLLFVALDGEEEGLLGATAFLKNPPVPKAQMALNVNLDMVSRNDRGEIYVAGTAQHPSLKPLLEQVAARSEIKVLFGHDSANGPGEDWTMSSDHGVFHKAGIPFIYFGVEDHPDYHQPTDDADKIDPVFFGDAVATILDAVLAFDADLSHVLSP